MSGTYSEIYIHFVFAVKFKDAVIMPDWRETLHKYITGIARNNGHKLIAISSTSDHLHLLVDFNVKSSTSELMRLVKGDSSEFINKKKFTPVKFHWQSGYIGFSISKSCVDKEVKKILNQENFYQDTDFRTEFISLLKEHGVDFDERYLFEPLI